MNKILLFLGGLLAIAQGAKGQLLTLSPQFPADTSTVTITVDCSKGNQGLYNYTPSTDVYVHIGVITNLSANTSDWRYAPFTWGTANPAAQATSLGNNKYSYTIHDIRAFFGVPAGETIQAVAILFRNGTGALAQRNADGSDMFVTVYPEGAFTGQFTRPPFQPYFHPIPEPITKSVGDTLPVTFLTSKPAT